MNSDELKWQQSQEYPCMPACQVGMPEDRLLPPETKQTFESAQWKTSTEGLFHSNSINE